MAQRCTVLIVDDTYRASTYDQWFAEHAETLAAQGRPPDRFERYGEVLTTVATCRAALLAALNDGVLPDVVLLDHLIPPSRDRPYEQSSLAVMRFLRDECAQRGIEIPKAVLFTARYHPTLAYAFVQAGGQHAVGREDGPDRMIDVLWQVIKNDAHWAHAEPKRPLRLGEKTAELLPYLHADMPVADIVADYKRRGVQISPDTVHERRRLLVSAINGQLGLDIFGTGRSTSLAEIALQHGHIWIPLEFRES